MARDPKRLRKAYEFKLGKDLVDKLSDAQILSLSNYYNRASSEEQTKIDNEVFKGMGDFLDTARQMAEDGFVPDPKLDIQKYKNVTSRKEIDPVQETQDKLDKELKGKSDEILSKIDELIEDYKQKVKDGPDGGKKSGALAVISKPSESKSIYEEVPNEELMGDEEIDPEVLKSLGLEDATDLTYDEYRTLLKEKLVANRQTDAKGVSSETDEKLREELKRVRTQKGKFKVKSTGAKMASSFVRPSARSGNPKSSPKATQLLSGVEEEKEKDEKVDKFVTNQLPKSLEDVVEGMNAINAMLMSMLAFDKTQAEIERQAATKAERSKEEQESEKSVKKSALGTLKSVIPKMGFLDMLKKYFGNILAGGAVLGLLKWLKDPENQEKLKQVSDFIVDKLPLIGAGILGFLALNIGAKLLTLLGVLKNIVMFLPNFFRKLRRPPNNGGGGNRRGGGSRPPRQGSGPNAGKTRGGQPITQGSSRPPRRTGSAPVTQSGGRPVRGTGRGGGPKGPKGLNPATLIAGMVVDYLAETYIFTPLEKGVIQRKVEESAGKSREEQEARLDKLEELMKKEEEYQKSGLHTADKAINLGGETSSEKKLRMMEAEYDAILRLQDEQAAQANAEASSGGQESPGPGGQGIQRVQGADYDVIIPLDHAKKAGSVADDPSGTSFTQSNATGADGREREHQDRAAQKLKAELEKQGIRVKIVTPEEHGNYQDYDKFIRSQSEKGVRVVPLHFDAAREGGGVGFLTRTRAGDQDDATFAAPIQQALSDFQKKNPDLGNLGQDTKGNATVNQGAASPTALVELGEMVKWEQKHGKNFTDSPEFMELIRGVAGGISQGVGGGIDAPETAPMTPAQLSDSQDLKGAPPPPVLPPPPNLSALPTSAGGPQPTSSTHAGQHIASNFSPRDPMDETSASVEEVYNVMVV